MALDAKRMITLLFLTAYLAGGIAAGVLYFCCVWWNARQLAAGGRAVVTILLMLGRLTLLGGVLTLASRAGAMPLLLMAPGVLLGRFLVMRGLRIAAP
jgi:predicted phage tail protein